MPTFRNDGNVTYLVTNADDEPERVVPGSSVESYDPLSGEFSDLVQTSSLPTLHVDISGENQWTGSICPEGRLNVSVSGVSWSATVTLQRSFDDFTTPLDVAEYTSNTELSSVIDEDPDSKYRIGVDSGDFTSGVVTVKLSK